MIAAFKLTALPVLIYLMVWLACALSLARRPQAPTYLFALFAPLPTVWYPSQALPLGSAALTLLVAFALLGGWLARSPGQPTTPHGRFLLFYIFTSYLYLWSCSLHFYLAAPLSSDNPRFEYWRSYVLMILGYFAAFYALRTRSQVRILIYVFLGVVAFLAWREITAFGAGSGFSYTRRADGPFWLVGLNANHFGAFVANYGVMALALGIMDKESRLRRLACFGVFALSLYPLFFSYSRGAYAAMLLALGVIGVLRYRPLLVVLVVLLIFWQTVLPDSVIDRITMTETSEGDLEGSAAGRLVVWELAKQLFVDHPVFGIGFQGFIFASQGLELHNVHNFFLQIAAEEGVVGLVLFAMLLYRAVASGWKLYRKGATESQRALGLGFLACLSSVVVTNLFGDRFSQIELGAYFFLLWGAVDRARTFGPDPALPRRAQAVSAPVGPSLHIGA